MSGAVWTRYLVPPKLGDSSAAAELIMATAAVKEAVAHRNQAAELMQSPWGPTLLYLDAPAVLYGTTADQVSREIKCIAAYLAVVQEARAQGRTKTWTIDEGCHPADILTKPLQGKEFAFKRGRLLELRFAPPTKLDSRAVAVVSDSGAESETDRARCAPPGSAPGTWSRAVEGLFARGRG